MHVSGCEGVVKVALLVVSRGRANTVGAPAARLSPDAAVFLSVRVGPCPCLAGLAPRRGGGGGEEMKRTTTLKMDSREQSYTRTRSQMCI